MLNNFASGDASEFIQRLRTREGMPSGPNPVDDFSSFPAEMTMLSVIVNCSTDAGSRGTFVVALAMS